VAQLGGGLLTKNPSLATSGGSSLLGNIFGGQTQQNSPYLKQTGKKETSKLI
jgi:hypothetical protein